MSTYCHTLPRMGAVGLNYGAQALERHFANGNEFLELAGVCDLDAGLATAVARHFETRAFPSLDTMLADASLDAIALFTPPHNRADLIRKCLRAGKHVFATKPFELDATAAADVFDDAGRRGLALHSNSPGPAYPDDLAQIMRWRTKHDLGSITGALAEVYGDNHEQSDGSWMDDPARCPGGPMFRLGIYLINDLGLLMGEPVEVRMLSSRVRTGRPTPDNALLSMAFESGALASIYASLCVRDGDAYRNSLVLHFERGSVYRNVGGEKNLPAQANLTLVRMNGNKRMCEQAVVRADPHKDYRWDWFAAAIRGEALPNPISRQGFLAGVKMVEMMALCFEKNSEKMVIREAVPCV